MKSTIIWFAITIHAIWAVLLVSSQSVTQVTGINLLYEIFPNRFLLAFIFALSSFLAYLALNRYTGAKSVKYLLLQQFLLIIPAIQVITIIAAGQFADGTVRSREFLTADKLGLVLFAFFHTLSLLQFHHINEDSDGKT